MIGSVHFDLRVLALKSLELSVLKDVALIVMLWVQVLYLVDVLAKTMKR